MSSMNYISLNRKRYVYHQIYAYKHSITDEVAIRNLTDEELIPQKQDFFLFLVMSIAYGRNRPEYAS